MDQIQQREQQRLDDWSREKRQNAAPPLPLPAPPPTAPLTSTGPVCFTVRSVMFEGADHLSQSEKDALAAPYLGRCIPLSDAEKIVRAVTDLYGAKGAVTTRAYIPPQDVSSGNLRITVVEGRIQGFLWNNVPADAQSEIKTAFPSSAGDMLNLRDLEQGIDQLNRLPSNDAKLKLVPGDKPGQTMIAIDNKQTKPWRVSAGIDNSGQRSTGEMQENLSAEWDDLLGLNDSFSLRHGQDRLNNSSERSSRNWSFTGSVPYGYWTLSTALSYMQYRSVVYGQSQSFQTWGVQRNARVGLDRVIYRDDVGKTSAGVNLTYISLGNDVAGAIVDASSPKLLVAGVSLDHARRLLDGVLHATLEYDSGLHALGARDDRQSPGTAKAQFTKYQADLAYSHPFAVKGVDFSWSSTAHGQWTTDSLYSTEQIAVGGASTVRGYKDQSLQGNRGAYLRNELSANLPGLPEEITQSLGTISPFVGYDTGIIANFHPEAAEPGVLSGWTTGVRLNGRWLRGELSYAWALNHPSMISPHSREVAFSLSLAY